MRSWTKTTRSARFGGFAIVLAVALAAAACGSSGGGAGVSSSTSGAPHAGGSLTVLEDSGYAGAWPGLDPATNTSGAADQSYMDSIFGQLFELGPGGKIINDLATGYKYADGGKTVTIFLRPGVKFTDGSPFNASAVVFNIKRDLKSPCTCKPMWPLVSVAAQGGNAVVIKLSRVFAPTHLVLHRLDRELDRLADRAGEDGRESVRAQARRRRAVQRSQRHHELGAGAEEEPALLAAGPPLPGQADLQAVGGDEAAYEALLAGEGQVYENMSTPALIKPRPSSTSRWSTSCPPRPTTCSSTPRSRRSTTSRPGRRSTTPPTSRRSLQHIFNNLYPLTQSFTGPGGICYQPKVPGYRGLRPGQGQGAGQAARRADGQPGHDQHPGGQGDHAGPADRVGQGRDQDHDQLLRPGPLIQQFTGEEVAGHDPDRRAPTTRRPASGSASGSRPVPVQRRARPAGWTRC